MSQKKNSQYIKYALGEIILVVIGILLALQINNWNEESKRKKLKTNYLNSLLEDLSQDSLMVVDQLNFYKQDTAFLQNQIRRIKAHPHIDTLKQIARNELNTNVQIITAFNNKTYNTLINTGNIDLLEPWLIEELSRLDQVQKLGVSLYDISITSFSDNLIIYRQNYSSNDDAFAGELLDPIWENITYNELMVQFNQIMTAKLTTDTNILQLLPAYLEFTTELSERIKELYD